MNIRKKVFASVITFYVLLLMFTPVYGAGTEMHKHEHMMGEPTYHMEGEGMHNGDAGICPVLHEKASKDYPYTYKGKTYYFCCPMCVDEFKKDPEKYISKIKEINLEAFQYGFSPDKIVVKKGDIVKIYATSRDVTHGFYIKEYGINVPIKKGEVSKIEFLADKAGEFNIICSIYCGPGHRDMRAKLIVEK